MIVAAHQPNYLPNLAFFHKMRLSDLFVIITNLQFEKQEGWQQRHKVKGPNGDVWLTVPVFGSQNQLIKEVKVNNQLPWRKKHKKTLELIYSRTSGSRFLPPILSLYEKEWQCLVDLNTAIILALKDILGIKTKVILDETVSGTKHQLLINICKKYHASCYLSGVGGKDYLDKERLKEIKDQGIEHKFVKKNLTALYPYSTVHYLFSFGKDWISDVI